MTGTAEIRLPQEFGFHGDMVRGFYSFSGPVFGFSRLGNEIEIMGDIAFKTGYGMADIAGDRFIGAAVFFRFWRRYISSQKSHGCMTTVTTRFNPGHHRVFFGMGYCQLKILDFVPMMGISLGHHCLGPLLVDIHMT